MTPQPVLVLSKAVLVLVIEGSIMRGQGRSAASPFAMNGNHVAHGPQNSITSTSTVASD